MLVVGDQVVICNIVKHILGGICSPRNLICSEEREKPFSVSSMRSVLPDPAAQLSKACLAAKMPWPTSSVEKHLGTSNKIARISLLPA